MGKVQGSDRISNMKKLDSTKNKPLCEKRKTDFSKDELLDILDSYLQYKPLFDEASARHESNIKLVLAAHELTSLLYEYGTADTSYFANLDKIKEKYGKDNIHDLSKEKLDFLEIITIFTFIHRCDHHGSGCCEACIEDNTYHNLLCRMEEIKSEI